MHHLLVYIRIQHVKPKYKSASCTFGNYRGRKEKNSPSLDLNNPHFWEHINPMNLFKSSVLFKTLKWKCLKERENQALLSFL